MAKCLKFGSTVPTVATAGMAVPTTDAPSTDAPTINLKTFRRSATVCSPRPSCFPTAVLDAAGWATNAASLVPPTGRSCERTRFIRAIRKHYELQYGHADGDQWTPSECDVSIRPGWFYHAQQDNQVKSPQQLADIYYRSVGHNGTMLLNFPVNRDGLIHPIDSTQRREVPRNHRQ